MDYASGQFRPLDAVKYLNRHFEPFESLHLDLRRCRCNIDKPEPPQVFSVQEFAALKHFFVNLDEFNSSLFKGGSREENPELLLIQLLPPNVTPLHLAGRITDDLPHLEESLLGLARAVSWGQFPRLEEVRRDQDEKLSLGVKFTINSTFAAARVSFGYDSWPLTPTTMGDGVTIPCPNKPMPLTEWEDPNL